VIAIVDYGVGNLANVEGAMRRAGASDVRISDDAAVIRGARAIVLPGVGHFGHCARELRARGLDVPVRDAHARGVPLLGLCVGMQLLFEGSEEDPAAAGLGLARGIVRRLRGPVRDAHARGVPLLGLCVGMQLLFEGSEEDPAAAGLGLARGIVRRLRGPVRVPHTGWNEVRLKRAHPWLRGIADSAHFYFVHSYAPEAASASALATTDHGGEFASVVGGDGFLGVQFHPEKSSLAGTRMLQGFVQAVS